MSTNYLDQFEELRPLLELIDNHRDELLDGWV